MERPDDLGPRRSGRRARRADWVAAAADAARVPARRVFDPDTGWRRSWQVDGGAHHLAFAADVAALVDAFTRLSEATGDPGWLTRAVDAADRLLADYADSEGGGFFTTADDGEALVARPKSVQDTPLPSANSAAAVALLRLAALVEDDRYRDAAVGVLALTGRFAGQHPTAFGHLLLAVELHELGAVEVTISGDKPSTDPLEAAYLAEWRPSAVLRWEPGGDTTALVCRNSVCELPTSDPAALTTSLGG